MFNEKKKTKVSEETTQNMGESCNTNDPHLMYHIFTKCKTKNHDCARMSELSKIKRVVVS